MVKLNNVSDNLGGDELKETSAKPPQSRFEYDLYHEEDDVYFPIIRVKHFNMPTEKWKIFEDAKITLIIEASKLTKKEKGFLRTVEGVNFLISQYKGGNKVFHKLKKEIKKASS